MILIIGEEITDRAAIRNFSGVWSYYLAEEFKRRGVAFRFDPGSDDPAYYDTLDLTGIHHTIGFNRYWSRIPRECAETMQRRLPGAVCQIYDRNRKHDPVDITFTLCNDQRKTRPRNVHIGWAADKELCKPGQGEALGVLIDHPNYGDLTTRKDCSSAIIADVAAFVRSDVWRSRWPSVRVRRLVDGGVEDVNLNDTTVATYTRTPAPFEVVCAEYAQAHIFMPTHPESAGLSVLETAMCGALTVAPHKFINTELLETVRHLTYAETVPWQDVLDLIDVQASRAKAIENSWPVVANNILRWLRAFRK